MNLVEFSELIVKKLVKEPDLVKVEEFEDGDNTVIEIVVSEEDMGRVIGKKGKIATSIKTLIQAKAYNEGNNKVKVNIDSFQDLYSPFILTNKNDYKLIVFYFIFKYVTICAQTGDFMSKSYVFYLNNSIIKQSKYPNCEVKNIIFRKPHRARKTDIVCFSFIIEANNHKINISGSLSEFNNKVSLNYTDGKEHYSDYFEYTEDGTLVRKSMIMNTSGKYELEEDTIEEKKYLLLERK